MAFKNKHIRIEAFGSTNNPTTGKNLIDKSVLRLARLLGRQIAREESERQYAKATGADPRKGEAAI
ncbi:hypothetical protein ACVWXP_007553 [Bradyrhizobium sp. USDA 4463]